MIRTLFTIALVLFTVGTANAQNDVKDKFIAMLNGSEAAAERAVKTFCAQDVIENGMIPMGTSPVIYAKDGDCYSFHMTEDDELNYYIICSEGDKIVSFDWDLEATEDEDEEE